MRTVSSTSRIASTAAWSADSFAPRPIQRAAAIAPASVTRTSSIAMLRSGAWRVLTAAPILHSFGRFDPDEVEAARDHRLGRAAEGEPKRLLVALEHAVLVVEAVEVVGHADRILRDSLWAALCRRVFDHRRKLCEPLDELALL